MTNDEHVLELEALEGQLVADEPEAPLTPEEQAEEERKGISKSQLKGLVGIGLTAGYSIAAPNWGVQPNELEDATDATMAAIEHYFPDIDDFDHPLLMVAIGLAMPAIPRLAAGVPMKLPKPEDEEQAVSEQPEVTKPEKQKASSNVAKVEEIDGLPTGADLDVNKLLEEVGA